MIRKSLTALLVAALLVGAAPAAEAGKKKRARTTTSERIRVVDHNIAGGVLGGDPAAMSKVEDQIAAFSPDLVTMQEVCYTGQYLAFREAHPDWSVRFNYSRASHPGCDGGALGNVLASPWPTTNTWTADLPHWSHSREQRILCADLNVGGHKALVCTVHLKAAWAAEQSEEHHGLEPGTERAAQIQKVADLTRGYKSRGPVVVAGDFNTPIYAGIIQPMKDRYNEVNSGSGEGGRIDHVWSAGQGVTGLLGSILGTGLSDHPLIRGTVQLS